MTMLSAATRITIARMTAPLFFWLSLAFLVGQACLVVLWVDVPNLRESALVALEEVDPEQEQNLADIGQARAIGLGLDPQTQREELATQHRVVTLLLLIWPLIIAESVFHWLSRSWSRANRWFHFYGFLFCLCPSLRLCARSVEMDRRLWLPGLGWRRSDKRLRRRLERTFSLPMIAIALLILPVLAIEFFFKAQVVQHEWLRFALHVSTGVIWFAFALEFILMVSVAEKKFDYIRTNWIDLAIILLPLLSFLRSLSLVRSTKVAKLLRVSKLTRLASMYRMRATAVKALRALILWDVLERLLRPDPEKQLQKLKEDLNQRELEIRILKREIYRAERKLRRGADDSEAALTGTEIAVAADTTLDSDEV
ncbi:potassium channel protein [Crateriforma conspicua]|nr:potassium channel protein [Crateriforma conspicua]